MPARIRRILFALPVFVAALVCRGGAAAAGQPQVDGAYQRFFVHFVDQRSYMEKALNAIRLTGQDVGRSFALVAGVSEYPNLGPTERTLAPAAEDIRKLTDYLRTQEFFDEIVVLQNADVTIGNLNFFLHQYFPNRLRAFPKSRFLFAYSGHGMTEGAGGYLLTSGARSLTDRDNSLSMTVLRSMAEEIVEFGHHVLVLLNSCYGGTFLRRPFGPTTAFPPRYPGAHAITAGGTREIAWHDARVGTGSIFFEKLFAGLDGRADVFPRSGDGLITVDELAVYLKQEVQISTDQNQNPQVGDLSRDGSRGGFFFLNRRRMVENGMAAEWKPGSGVRFGADARTLANSSGTTVIRELGLTRIAFASGGLGIEELYTMKVDGTEVRRITNGGGWGISWSPDATRIAFINLGTLYVMNADGSNPMRLKDAVDGNGLSWSPDGMSIAYQLNGQISVMNVDGTNQRFLTTARSANPSWSPDGRKLVYSGNPPDIYVINIDGTNEVNLTENPAIDHSPSWSPDGTSIAFVSNRDGPFDMIYVMNADGTNPRRLTPGGQPSWSPDGTKIVFINSRDYVQNDIYVMNADGSNVINLINSPAYEWHPSWSPFMRK